MARDDLDNPLRDQRSIDADRIPTGPRTSSRAHQIVFGTIATPNIRLTAVPAGCVLARKPSPLPRYAVPGIGSVERLAPAVLVLRIEQSVDFIEFDGLDMRKVGTINKRRPLRVRNGDAPPRLIVLHSVTFAAARIALQNGIGEKLPHHVAGPFLPGPAVFTSWKFRVVEEVSDRRAVEAFPQPPQAFADGRRQFVDSLPLLEGFGPGGLQITADFPGCCSSIPLETKHQLLLQPFGRLRVMTDVLLGSAEHVLFPII
ncbi:MAG: hypothetical protein AB7U20_25395, partial [Planctomycetaceae bacterium]